MDAEQMKLHAGLSRKIEKVRLDCIGIKPDEYRKDYDHYYYSNELLRYIVTKLSAKWGISIHPEIISISEPHPIIHTSKTGELRSIGITITKNYEIVDTETGYSIRMMGMAFAQNTNPDNVFKYAHTACEREFYETFLRLTDKADNKKKEEPIAEQPQPIAQQQPAQSSPPPPPPTDAPKPSSDYKLYLPMFNSKGKLSVDSREYLITYIDAEMKKGTHIDAIVKHLTEYRYNELDAYCINGLIHHNSGGKILLAKSKAGKLPLTSEALTEFCRILGQKPNGKTLNDIVKASRQYIEQYDYTLEYHHLQGRILAKIVSEQPPTQTK